MKYYFKCPNCGSDEEFINPTDDTTNNLGCLLVLLGHLFLALLLTGYLRGRIQCTKCFRIFRQPPLPSSPLANFSTEIIAAALVPVLAAFVLSFSPEIISDLPSVYGLGWLERTFAAEPRLAAYLVAAILLIVIGVCLTAAIVSNYRYRNELAKEYILKPFTSRSLNPQSQPRSKPDAGDAPGAGL